ncbi:MULTISPECIES: MDR family MFS transporter [unclassified Staphylococcus]|uniref:MDR family MFS transporter n=2 Tax=Staphylococcus TaxID=1279 RepID=UPI0021D3A35C|nr:MULTISPECIES: MDR family MFS transporter [unclassified Staphylococcus]UXR74257.1 DHA2 family efflux MFS transporter permease subunit [Staphylococcus sp. IVB6238]UXR76646.1 DHA2 family efflux MFS transporter permease subunit [Staphylococcus sp. IVB6233]UXR80775.1 DHA2 family efflux MFS transporter permease subunit [Staphylococcus sp. IVB6218]
MAEQKHTKVIMAVFLVGAFFMILNETLLNIALKELMEQFNISRATVQWMASGFMMVIAIVSPLSALIIQWFTTRRLFLFIIVIFTIGTFIAGMAVNFPMLLTGRMIQAIGTGLIMPLIMNTMLMMFDASVRGRVMGLFGLIIMFAPAIGPTLSGVIVDYLGWRWLFFIVIPFMIFAFIFGWRYLENVGEVTRPKIDVLSVILSTIGITGVIYSISMASDMDILSAQILVPFVIGLIAVVIFIRRQLKLEIPILDFRVLQVRNYRRGMLIFVIVVMSLFASEIVMPMYLQGPMGFSAKLAGLILLPGALLNGLLSPVMGRIFDSIGPRKMILPGLVTLLAVMIFYTTIHPGVPVWQFIVAYMLLMVAVAAIMMPSSTNGLNALPMDKYPHGTAIFNVLQPLAGSAGISVFVGILTAVQNNEMSKHAQVTQSVQNHAMTAGLHAAYLFAIALIVIGIVIAVTLTNSAKESKQQVTE